MAESIIIPGINRISTDITPCTIHYLNVVGHKAWHRHAASNNDVKLVLLAFAAIIMLPNVQFACRVYLLIEACETRVRKSYIKSTSSGHSRKQNRRLFKVLV